MQFTTILLTAIWPLALAIPTPSSHQPDRLQKRFQEAIPWELSNIAVFNAALGPSGVSLISFHFCDTNTGIELETECSREMAPGSGQSVIDPDNYYPCNNSTVSFAYTGTALFIHRSYIDPAVGPCPLYCNVGAFGNSNTSFVVTNTSAGTSLTKAVLRVPITALIAK